MLIQQIKKYYNNSTFFNEISINKVISTTIDYPCSIVIEFNKM